MDTKMTENKTPDDLEEIAREIVEEYYHIPKVDSVPVSLMNDIIRALTTERAKQAELLKQCETMAAALEYIAYSPTRDCKDIKAREALAQWEEFKKGDG